MNDTASPGPIQVKIDEDLADIVPNFLKNRQKDAAAVQRALADGDFETIRILGHGMKGVGAGYGFDYITELGREMEQAAVSHNAAALADLNDKLIDYVERVEVIYE
jgi:HPt (histidine-containing phosphotransfer) domain-containing protein